MANDLVPVKRNELVKPDALLEYRFACLAEPLMERWRECLYHGCKRRKRCLGGPRGTFKKFGRPMCFAGEGR